MTSPAIRELSINGYKYAILDDAQLTGNKRALTRSRRDSNTSDPARIRRVQWELSTPIGYSLQSASQVLATDTVQNLETRFTRRLISKGARNAVTLTTYDPPAASSGYFGGARFGINYFGTLSAPFGPTIGGANVTVFDEQGGSIFAHAGVLSRQVLISSWTNVATATQAAAVRDADTWYGKGRVALGPTAPMQTRTGVSASSATYANTTSTSPAASVYASAVKRGSDRAWIIDAASADQNNAGYTLDGFVTMASPFQVGDPNAGATGIGPFGPYTFFGAYDNLYSFTDQGKPVPLSRALSSHRSANNGAQWADPGWGWNYAMTDIGLRALTTNIDNPVGIGERMRDFTGHNGRPTAVWQERGELWVAYYTTAGDSYIYRGVFGPETSSTGQPLFFPAHYLASTFVGAMFSTNTPTNTAFLWAEGTNMAYETIARDGRDDLFTARVYSTGGGTWFGTTLDADPLLLKTLRMARIRTVGLTSGSSWALAFAFDSTPASASYVTVGTVTTNGFSDLYPVSGSGVTTAPLTNISGRTLKPRLTQVAAGSGASTTPPEVNGVLEAEYDERPDTIEVVEVVISVTGTAYEDVTVMDRLRDLMDESTNGPVAIVIPDDLPPNVGGQRYGMVASVEKRQDLKDNGIEAVTVTLHMWPTAASIA